MAQRSGTHLDQDSLVRFLWLAAHCPGASEPLVHLLRKCPECYCPPLQAAGPGEGEETHFDAESLGSLVWALLSEGTAMLGYLEHLLARCEHCQALGEPVFRSQQEAPELSEKEFDDVVRRLSRRVENWRSSCAREQEGAPALLAELRKLTPERRLLRVCNSPRFQTWPLVGLVLAESLSHGLRDPAEALRWAQLGVDLAERLDPVAYDPEIVEDVKAQAWAHVGNAYRVANDLNAADDAFERARFLLQGGSWLPAVRAEIWQLEASLRCGQRRFDAAEGLLEEALEIYRELGDRHLQGRVRISQALVQRESGRLPRALKSLRLALKLIDREQEPRLELCARHNLVDVLIDLERFAEAERRLPEVIRLAEQSGQHLDRVRLHWMEGRIDAGLERPERAERKLLAVRDELLTVGLVYDGALVALELAMIYQQQERLADIQLLVQEMLPVFRERSVSREATAALLLLVQAAASRKVTAELLRQVADRLQRAKTGGGAWHPGASNG